MDVVDGNQLDHTLALLNLIGQKKKTQHQTESFLKYNLKLCCTSTIY